MNLCINQVLEWLPDNETAHIFRVLWIEQSGTDVVTIELLNSKALPIWHKAKEIEENIAAGIIHILQVDPYASLQRPDETISALHRSRRDEAWKVIAPLVETGTRVFIPQERGSLVVATVKRTGRTKRTIYRYLRRYWQGGQTPNALLPLYDQCGGKDKERQSHSRKRGRPSQLSKLKGEPPGINVDANIRQLLVRGAKLFHEKQGKPLIKAYQLTLEQFFHSGYSEQNGVLSPILVPTEERPTYRQFEYWYNKERELKQSLISRQGQRRFNLEYREVLGCSTDFAYGPGSLWQIDATVGDIYLVSYLDRSRIIGRPVIYLIVDTFSRLIVGFSVSLEGPSWLGAMLALSNATADKVQFCQEYGIEITQDQWPTHHLPEAILADRGELLSANANNLVNALGIRIANTPPYRPDWKPIVERQFRLNNDEVIHWVPGAVYQPRERGDKDTRLDAVLDLNEFRQLMIHLIVHYNSCHRLDEYPMDKFMIADGVEPYPIDLWQWGIANRGRPRTCTPEIVRLNLLPTGSATVTERGIRFEKMFYTCELALSEQWFVKARVGKSWKIPIAYDPRNLNTIYLRLDNSKRIEVCKLLDTCKTFKQRDWHEAVDYWALKKQAKQMASPHQQQASAALNAQINHIVSQATSKTEEACEGHSKMSRLRCQRENRRKEREDRRSTEFWQLGEEEIAHPLPRMSEEELADQPKEASDGYVPPPQPLDKLRALRQRSWNNDQ